MLCRKPGSDPDKGKSRCQALQEAHCNVLDRGYVWGPSGTDRGQLCTGQGPSNTVFGGTGAVQVLKHITKRHLISSFGLGQRGIWGMESQWSWDQWSWEQSAQGWMSPALPSSLHPHPRLQWPVVACAARTLAPLPDPDIRHGAWLLGTVPGACCGSHSGLSS